MVKVVSATAVFLLLLLFWRITQIGGLTQKYSDPELENLSSYFMPLRDSLVGKLDQSLPQPQAALLAGIILGVKSSLPQEFKNALRRTSTIHIVVVSGQNLTLLVGFLTKLGFILGRRKAILISFFVLIFYPLLTGLQVPVIRAAIMLFFALIAQFLGREKDSVWILLLTAFIMLIYNPNWISSISFQLSFLATVGVIVVAPELVKKLGFLPQIIKQDFAVSLAAQLLTWPVIAANFHQASLIGILANTLILWVVSFVMASGIIALLVLAVNPMLGGVLMMVPGILLTYFVYVVGFLGKFSFASIYVGDYPAMVWVGYYLAIAGLFFYLKKMNEKNDETLDPII